MQQTLRQLDESIEALDRLATQKEAANKAKDEAEGKLEVSACHLLIFWLFGCRNGCVRRYMDACVALLGMTANKAKANVEGNLKVLSSSN
jgi:hypothetical protein